jgi:alkylhydroperoxidase family enzyme
VAPVRPRVPLVQPARASAPVRRLYRSIERLRGELYNLHKTLAHAPAMLEGYMAMSVQIRDRGALPDRLRELVILRVAQLVRSDYEWAQHARIAPRVGITDAELRALRTWRRRLRLFSARERAALGFAEDLSRTRRVDDATFRAAARHFSHRELVELALTVGWYELTARVLLAFEVPLER